MCKLYNKIEVLKRNDITGYAIVKCSGSDIYFPPPNGAPTKYSYKDNLLISCEDLDKILARDNLVFDENDLKKLDAYNPKKVNISNVKELATLCIVTAFETDLTGNLYKIFEEAIKLASKQLKENYTETLYNTIIDRMKIEVKRKFENSDKCTIRLASNSQEFFETYTFDYVMDFLNNKNKYKQKKFGNSQQYIEDLEREVEAIDSVKEDVLQALEAIRKQQKETTKSFSPEQNRKR